MPDETHPAHPLTPDPGVRPHQPEPITARDVTLTRLDDTGAPTGPRIPLGSGSNVWVSLEPDGTFGYPAAYTGRVDAHDRPNLEWPGTITVALDISGTPEHRGVMRGGPLPDQVLWLGPWPHASFTVEHPDGDWWPGLYIPIGDHRRTTCVYRWHDIPQ